MTGFVVAPLALFALATARRLNYPFALEWMESGSFDSLARLSQGAPLYARPSLEFIPFNYTPLYYLVSAQLARFTGDGFLPLRLVSLASAYATLVMVAGIVRQTGASWFAALAAASTLAATYALTGTYTDTARPDSLYVLLLTAGLLALLRARSRPWFSLLTGALFGAAYLTKQSALPSLGLLVLYLLVFRRAVGLGVLAGFAAVAGSVTAWFLATTQGWYGYYTFEIAAGYSPQFGNALNLVSNQLGPMAVSVLFGAAWLVWPARARTRSDQTLIVAVTSFAVGCWWLSLYPGTASNVGMPLAMGCSLLLGLGLDAVLVRTRSSGPLDAPRLIAIAYVALALQWLPLLNNPAKFVPRASDVAAGQLVVKRIAATPGDVLVPNHGYLARLAGKPGQAHALALSNAVHGERRNAARAVMQERDSLVAAGRYEMLVLDASTYRARDPLPGYGPPEELFTDRDVFVTRAGMPTRPEVLRHRLAGGDGASSTTSHAPVITPH